MRPKSTLFKRIITPVDEYTEVCRLTDSLSLLYTESPYNEPELWLKVRDGRKTHYTCLASGPKVTKHRRDVATKLLEVVNLLSSLSVEHKP